MWAGIVGLLGLAMMGVWLVWQWQQPHDWRWTRKEPRCLEATIARIGKPVRVFGDPAATQWLLLRFPQLVRVHFLWEYIAVAAPHPRLAELIGARTAHHLARIDGRAARQEGIVPIPWGAIIGEVPQSGISGEIGGLQGNGAPGWVANQIIPPRGDGSLTVRSSGRGNPGIAGDNGIQDGRCATVDEAPAWPAVVLSAIVLFVRSRVPKL
jgi:hypothetical protein